MFEKWASLSENLGKAGSEEGIILLDDELPGVARVSIEKKFSEHLGKDIYPITMGVYGWLVHTAFFSAWEDALECADSMKLIIQVMENRDSWQADTKTVPPEI